MKIVVYFNSMLPAGGIERVIAKHIQFFSENHEVFLITKDAGTSFYKLPDNIKQVSIKIDTTLDMSSRYKRIFKIFFSFFKISQKLRNVLGEINPDIIYVASPLCLLELIFAKFSYNNIVVSEHASYLNYNSVYKFIVQILYKRVGLLTVPTSDDSRLYDSLGIPNFYLPNPLSFFPNEISNLQNKVVLHIGRFTDDKRQELLIDIWAKSEGRKMGWILKIIGTGENEQKIKLQVANLDLYDCVEILPPTKAIDFEYLSSSIFVLTSRSEGFGLVLAEAMACGVPCVAFNCPSGPKDIITDNHNGFLITEGDNDLFVLKLDLLIENEELRMKFGLNARTDIQKFDEKIISEKLNKLILDKFKKR